MFCVRKRQVNGRRTAAALQSGMSGVNEEDGQKSRLTSLEHSGGTPASRVLTANWVVVLSLLLTWS